MGSEPDDIAGPPPDPTERVWRHPSEIAAANAFAAREAEEADRGDRARWSVALGGAAGIAACLGLFAVAASMSGGARPTIDAASRLTTPTTAAASAPTVADTLGRSAETTTSTAARASSTVAAASMASASSATLPPGYDSGASDGVHLVLGDAEPIAHAIEATVATPFQDLDVTTVTFVGGEPGGFDRLLLTSAAATQASDELSVMIDGAAYSAAVVAADRYTDVAVLGVWNSMTDATPDDGESSGDAVSTEQPTNDALPTEDRPSEASTTRAAAPGDVVVLAGHDHPDPAQSGRVVSVDQMSSAVDGHPLIGAVLTSIAAPDVAAGSALCDDTGTVIGMVVAGQAKLATAVPITDAGVVAWALVHHGAAGSAHLGVAGRGTTAGIELTSVTDGGPAATAGLASGDVVTMVDGVAVTDFAALVALLRTVSPGDTVVVTIDRTGTELELTIHLGGDR
ncbi:MAG: S1C family serine protease [Acidimicrobiales bacterium]